MDKKNFIYYYNLVLESITSFIKTTIHFICYIIDLFPAISIRYIIKLGITLAFYSKLIIIISTFVTTPEIIINITTNYWSFVTSMYIDSVVFISGVLHTLKSMMEESNNTTNTINDLKTQIEDLKLTNSNQQKKIDYLHENSIPKNIYSDISTTQLNKITELTGELRALEHMNKILTTENIDLSNTVKTMKTTSTIERSQQYLTILGNTAFIGVQVINAYNFLFNNTGNTNYDDIKKILASVNSLIARFHNQQTQNTAFTRSQQSIATNQPSSGLTNTDINPDDV